MARENDIRKLGELIKDIKFVMLTTACGNGTLHSRPMAMQQIGFDGDLWFFTGASTEKVHDVARERHVNVSFADPDDNRYVSVSGTAELIRDRERARELWNPVYKAWFPKGLDDPDLALLRVRVERAEYWDSPSGPVVQLAGFLKAMTGGGRYRESEHGEVKL